MALSLAAAVLAAACALVPNPSAVPWGATVPQAAPEVVAAQPVVARGDGTVTLFPVSPKGAVVGVGYGYDMPHCGINSPIDIDGSFWDAIGEPSTSVDFDGATGLFQLVSPSEARFLPPTGRALRLARHSGAKEFGICS
ncbi:MAG: hypothetical protein H0V73_09730 [Chloroflexi bacterium]|nr:hypothetical protein [Chloroflexota bacterium]